MNTNWKYNKLSDLCAKIGDGLHGTPTYSKNTGYFFVNGNNLKGGKIEINSNTKSISKNEFEKYFIELNRNTLLLGINGSIGNTAFYQDEKIMLGKSIAYLNFKSDINRFYYYYFQLNVIKKYFYDVATGSTIKNLSLKSIQDFQVPVPDVLEYRSITSILEKIDQKIEINNKINSELEKMAKLIYDYWFVQFDFPDENCKPYKSSGGKMVWNEELKKDIPEKWKVKKVADFLDVVTGKEDANFASDSGKYAYFTCGRKVLKCNDAVFSGKSVLIAGNGSFDVKYYNGKFNAYQRVYVLKPRDEKFIGIIYRSVVRNISRFTLGSQGSIVKFITKGDVENISILVPDNLELLTQLNSILDMTQNNDFESEQLATLRDWLLPMLMNGQVKVQEN